VYGGGHNRSHMGLEGVFDVQTLTKYCQLLIRTLPKRLEFSGLERDLSNYGQDLTR